ncbi:TetR/AcrR family transcriptional regulator [Streptomyces sp. LARHCF252]
MSDKGQQGRKRRADVQRNRAALLEAAQRHSLNEGVGASLEAVAKEAGVGPATLYRHFPAREALLAAVLHTRSEELVARRAEIAQLGDASEALRQWLRAMRSTSAPSAGRNRSWPQPGSGSRTTRSPFPAMASSRPPTSACGPHNVRATHGSP